MEVLMLIGLIVIICVFVASTSTERRVMHDVDRMIEKNAKDSEKYFKKEYGEDFGKKSH